MGNNNLFVIREMHNEISKLKNLLALRTKIFNQIKTEDGEIKDKYSKLLYEAYYIIKSYQVNEVVERDDVYNKLEEAESNYKEKLNALSQSLGEHKQRIQELEKEKGIFEKEKVEVENKAKEFLVSNFLKDSKHLEKSLNHLYDLVEVKLSVNNSQQDT